MDSDDPSSTANHSIKAKLIRGMADYGASIQKLVANGDLDIDEVI